MNSKALIGLVAAVVVIGGGAWYFSSHSSSEGTMGTESEGQTQGESGTLSFKELMMMAGSKKCEVTVNTPDAPATGTVYVSNGEVRSDVMAKPKAMGGKEIAAHMIKSGDYVYSWTDMMPQGVKVKLTAAESAGASSGYDANAQVEYSCAPWIADASMFAVPSSVTFMEFSGAAGGTLPAGSGMEPPPGKAPYY